MDRLDRIYGLHRILKAARYPVARERLADELECSESTVYRVREALAAQFGAPIEAEPGSGRLYYAAAEKENFELPGLWFNASELYALLSIDQLLANVAPGVVDAELAPLRERLEAILAHRHLGAGELAKRVRILGFAERAVDTSAFRVVAGALAERRRLAFAYHARANDTTGQRCVSPQRLTRYRDNWYLDAWDHERDNLRSFSLDRIAHPHAANAEARDIDEAELDRRLATAYGIFSGEPAHTAVLCFKPERAQWVAAETWHPQQQSRWLGDGRYELRIPYGEPTELILDILRYGDEVEVFEPAALREAVAEKLARATAQYRPHETR